MADDDYDVGYKKPPKTKQFKKGKSGNPGGRPKGSKNKIRIRKRSSHRPTSAPLLQACTEASD